MSTPNSIPEGWAFERIDERTIRVTCPTFTTPLELTLNSMDRKILAFYSLADDLLGASNLRPSHSELVDRLVQCDIYLREIRAENLHGSEPELGELLEKNTDWWIAGVHK